ncbi:glycosyltransferase family 2 protein [Raineyella fluvialis]|uniref:Glycosyltransferase n=1 Tax=Raineyella fluvialis TaxID=2662261 RepID=A0A5Q2FBW5_9ACTN|nr:glycosyltransferase family 2 protein [Raineyella fluvialis]QGF23891.1 glycosyltransferase [Raineyella fluvialis]
MPDDVTPDREGADVVVVLSYFGRDDTVACVESLVTGSPEASVLVIDNGSFDGVLEAVSQRWPQVATLQTTTNLGFSGGMNRGIQWALDAGASTITVLNNDTIVPPGVIRSLAKVARTGAAVSPEVRYADGTEKVWFAGGVIDSPTSLARHLSETEISSAEPTGRPALRMTQILAGCCVTASADTWRRIGLFDERYFLNFEDSDWSVRAAALNIPLVVATTVVIYHRVSASFTGTYSYLGTFYYTRNGLLFGAVRRPWSLATRARFLRRHVLPVVATALRQRQYTLAQHQGIIIIWAVLAHVVRRYGRAPAALERLVTRWLARRD